MLIDYHIHLERDSFFAPLRLQEDKVAGYVEQAAQHGVAEIGISEHCYRFVEFQPVFNEILEEPGVYPEVRQFLSACFSDSLADYVEFIKGLQTKGYPVKLGLEVDYVLDREAEIASAIGPFSWDYLLGSVHFLGKWAIDASPQLGWPDRDIDATYAEYFAVWERACSSHLFSSMSHPDLVKKFGHRPQNVPSQLFASAAQAASQAQVAVEVSSAGLRKDVGEVYPGLSLLQAFRIAGVPITLGSDAHSVEEIGLGLDTAADWARQAGYGTITRFSGRRGTQVVLTH